MFTPIILNKSYKKVGYLTDFESFIFTIRYDEVGELQITSSESILSVSGMVLGNFITLEETTRLMRIDTITESEQDDGSFQVEIAGPSFEQILDERVTLPVLPSGDDPSYTGYAGEAIRHLVRRFSIVGSTVRSSNDIIRNFTAASKPPKGTGSSKKFVYDIDTILANIQPIAQDAGLGFRVDLVNGKLVFRVYNGVDRSLKNGKRTPVSFNYEMGSLTEIEIIRSDANYKNICYVLADENTRVRTVARKGVSTSVKNFDRRVMVHSDSNIKKDWAEKMERVGKRELRKYNRQNKINGSALDTTHVFGKTYNLGDLVSLVAPGGRAYTCRVIEYIYAYDENGYKTYPTFEFEG